MPISYEIDGEAGIALVTIRGIVTAQEQREHVSRLLTDPEMRRPFRILSDRREQENIPSAELVQEMGRQLHGVERVAGSRLAFVVSQPVQVGMSRMFAAYASNMEIEIFNDIDSARAWLLEG